MLCVIKKAWFNCRGCFITDHKKFFVFKEVAQVNSKPNIPKPKPQHKKAKQDLNS